MAFEVYADGRWRGARGVGHSIFTQGATLDELYDNIKEATLLHFQEEVQKGEKLKILITTEAEGKGVRKAAAG